jgi:TRAP-type mannitol/chloroaromatic compound transport system permease small subunit
MKAAYAVAKLIDRVNAAIFRVAAWLVLVVTLVSSLNATVRWAFNYSSNAYLDLQLYLFAAVFLICAGYTFLENEHVRIDVLFSRFSRRTKLWVDVFGIVFFLLPFAGLTLWLSWAPFVDAFFSKETSPNAGGLIVWPARLLVVIGFFLLVAQGISELIKRLAELRGHDVDGPGSDADAKGLPNSLKGSAGGNAQ